MRRQRTHHPQAPRRRPNIRKLRPQRRTETELRPMSAPRNTTIGRSVPRLEDRPLLTGRGRFADDMSFPHQLHMRVVRSPVAHGRIVAVDTAACPRHAGDRCGVDRGRYCRRAADRFSRGPQCGARTLPPAGAGNRTRALCGRAGGRGVRERSLLCGGCRRSRRGYGRDPAGTTRRRCRSGRVLARSRHRGRSCAPRLWRHRCRDGARVCDREP